MAGMVRSPVVPHVIASMIVPPQRVVSARMKDLLGPLLEGLVINADGNLLDALGAAIKGNSRARTSEEETIIAALNNTGIPKVNVAAEFSAEEQPEVDLSDEDFYASTHQASLSLLPSRRDQLIREHLIAGSGTDEPNTGFFSVVRPAPAPAPAVRYSTAKTRATTERRERKNIYMVGVAFMEDIIGNVAYLDHHYFGLRRKVRSLFLRVRAEMRRQRVIMNKTRHHHHHRNFSFHYDPLSYALNFDNTCSAFLC
ncbi:hypothetical protein Sjap_014442 [Stephania japonica]|uniref:Uncharacterized protein n=1 Tax=Stephania japonica TaxID=461633 RepID=A0AAP0NRX0_9MAGN